MNTFFLILITILFFISGFRIHNQSIKNHKTFDLLNSDAFDIILFSMSLAYLSARLAFYLTG